MKKLLALFMFWKWFRKDRKKETVQRGSIDRT